MSLSNVGTLVFAPGGHVRCASPGAQITVVRGAGHIAGTASGLCHLWAGLETWQRLRQPLGCGGSISKAVPVKEGASRAVDLTVPGDVFGQRDLGRGILVTREGCRRGSRGPSRFSSKTGLS